MSTGGQDWTDWTACVRECKAERERQRENSRAEIGAALWQAHADDFDHLVLIDGAVAVDVVHLERPLELLLRLPVYTTAQHILLPVSVPRADLYSALVTNPMPVQKQDNMLYL